MEGRKQCAMIISVCVLFNQQCRINTACVAFLRRTKERSHESSSDERIRRKPSRSEVGDEREGLTSSDVMKEEEPHDPEGYVPLA